MAMGIHHIATCIELGTSKTVFYGQFLKHVRGHYFWLRRQLAEKGLQKVIKKIGDDESRITVDIIQKISRDLINRAVETNSLLVVGNLKGLSKKTKEYRRNFNRKLTSFQYYRFTQYLTYKGALAGVNVIKVFERLTSQICYRCVERGERTNNVQVCLYVISVVLRTLISLDIFLK
jgi:IS605 OrfB family transposase